MGVAVGSLLTSSCMSVRGTPSPGARVLGDIRGVILHAPERKRVEFAQVSDVRWSSDTLTIAGIVNASDRTVAVATETLSFPLEDVSYVLVRDFSPGKSFLASIGTGFAIGAGVALLMFHY